MSKEERQRHIVQLIESTQRAAMLSTHVLAEHFAVSEMTIRRDLQELSQDGLLRRQHGGAAPLRPSLGQQRKEIGILLVSKTGKYTDPFFNAVLEGADSKLHELGYNMAYINTREAVSTAAQACDLLQRHPVNGIILIGPPVGIESIGYLKANVPALVQTIESVGLDVDCITCDAYYGMQQMVDHLVKQGYTRLGFITGHYDERQQAFTDTVRANALAAEDELCVVVPFDIDGWTPELGHIGAEQLMQLPNPPDAIVCASDRIAIGAIQWLHQHGLHVPNDIAVTGFDNILESEFTTPPLTTVHVHKQLMGALAAERAVKRIENEHEVPMLIRTPTHLVIRQSCGSDAS